MWSPPLNFRSFGSILWRLGRVVIKRLVRCWEISITVVGILLVAKFDDSLDFLINLVLGSSLLHELVRIVHHLIVSFLHVLTLSEHLLVLLLSKRHTIGTNKLAWVVLTSHHLLLHHLLLVQVLLLLLRRHLVKINLHASSHHLLLQLHLQLLHLLFGKLGWVDLHLLHLHLHHLLLFQGHLALHLLLVHSLLLLLLLQGHAFLSLRNGLAVFVDGLLLLLFNWLLDLLYLSRLGFLRHFGLFLRHLLSRRFWLLLFRLCNLFGFVVHYCRRCKFEFKL